MFPPLATLVYIHMYVYKHMITCPNILNNNFYLLSSLAFKPSCHERYKTCEEYKRINNVALWLVVIFRRLVWIRLKLLYLLKKPPLNGIYFRIYRGSTGQLQSRAQQRQHKSTNQSIQRTLNSARNISNIIKRYRPP